MPRASIEAALRESGLSYFQAQEIADKLIARGDAFDQDLAETRAKEYETMKTELAIARANANTAQVDAIATRYKYDKLRLEKGVLGVALSRVFGDLHGTRGLTNLLAVVCLVLLAAVTVRA